MALIDFTTYDEVRSVLGVSTDEISDETIALGVYETGLKIELQAVATGLSAAYLAASQKSPVARSTSEQDLVDAVRLFSTYAVARQLTTSMPMAAPKEQTDNKASMVRFATDPYKETVRSVKESFEKYRGYLSTLYDAYTSSSRAGVARLYCVVSKPSSDPVAGT